MTNSYQAVFVMPFLHFNPPDSGKDAYENSLALLYRPVSVISEIWLPPNFTSKEITIMKTTYLFMDKSANGETCLVMGTLEQYKAITIANAKLPMEQRRHFIVDRIPEGGELDVMYIETDYSKYLEWRRQYVASHRNRQYAKLYTIISLDAANPIDESLTMHDCIPAETNVEQEAIENAEMDSLRVRLANWKPWAADLLDAVLAERYRECTHELAQKYGVTDRAMQYNKQQFEQKIIIFLNELRF